MTFPLGEPLAYSTPCNTQGLLVQATEVVPVIEIVASPSEITNSLQAHFEVRILVGDVEISSATLYYKLDNASSYTERGLNRTVDLALPTTGQHQIAFIAQYNSTYSSEVVFRWTIDTDRPSIIGALPANGSTNIGVRPSIEITFSKPMQTATVLSAINVSPAVTGNWVPSENGSKYSLSLTENLGFNQRYVVTVANTAASFAGNSLLSQFQFYFVTIIATNNPPEAPDYNGIINPTYTSANRARIAFNVPQDPNSDSLHFVMEVASNSTFTTGFMQFSTVSNPTYFSYFNVQNEKIYPFPANGVASGIGRVVFSGGTPFADGKYWYRVIADDRRG